jgi:hypothetical protein
MMSHHVFRRQADDSLLFLPRHRLGGVAEGAGIARLHFDEHQRRSVAGDDVQFSTAATMPPRNNCVPKAFELAAREIFAGFAQNNTVARHAGPPQQSTFQRLQTTKTRRTRTPFC